MFGLDAESLSTLLAEQGQPAFRGRQLAEAIYHQRLRDLNAISTLPASLRRQLDQAGWEIGRPRIGQIFRSVDGTERYLVECRNGKRAAAAQAPGLELMGSIETIETVETVWMPEGDGGESGDESGLEESGLDEPDDDPDKAPDHEPNDTGQNRIEKSKAWSRATICVSSQIGCAVNCQFCLTAKLGLQRNLSAGEIAGQAVAVMDRHGVQVGRDRLNLVFMGMGEPFLNYAGFMAAVRLLVREVGLSPRRMTVSTSGIVPGIEQFAQEPPELRPKLAISLNAPNDQIRDQIMPINGKWPIESILEAVRRIPLRSRERITFEYVLLSGVTDRPEQAKEVARLVRRANLPAKVNLIAWNPGPGIPYAMPATQAIENFKAALAAEGIPVYLRQPRGRDIYAACGQLKRTVEQ
ncbi:MAG TPA: 23S rRNA (adenine(2503)-C(2))-methyltransferase RlmN [Terracidiphilus sp.]|nr:23S rRNA (adenine(2503)-C(2))-methyltransferase RlmN [Terracidiphilus sp.]